MGTNFHYSLLTLGVHSLEGWSILGISIANLVRIDGMLISGVKCSTFSIATD